MTTNSIDPTDALRANFIALGLPDLASRWLLELYQVIQTFDDYADGDEVTREDLDALIWHALVSMPQNPFFFENHRHLMPLIASSVLKWQASDKVERDSNADAKSFLWRAGYYEIILMVVQLVRGPKFATDNAHLVLGLYGEELSDYLKEFSNA